MEEIKIVITGTDAGEDINDFTATYTGTPASIMMCLCFTLARVVSKIIKADSREDMVDVLASVIKNNLGDDNQKGEEKEATV